MLIPGSAPVSAHSVRGHRDYGRVVPQHAEVVPDYRGGSRPSMPHLQIHEIMS
jgi:hypothetical protein